MQIINRIFKSILVIIFISCSSNNLVNKRFSATNSVKSVSIEFINDSVCEIYQRFHCKLIPADFRSIQIFANYKPIKFKVIGYKNGNLNSTVTFKVKAIEIQNKLSDQIVRYTDVPNFFNPECPHDSLLDVLNKKLPQNVIYNFRHDTITINKKFIYMAGARLQLEMNKNSH